MFPVLLFSVLCLSQPNGESASKPLVLGHGEGLFKVGPLLARDDFESLDNWVVQIQERSGSTPAKVETKNGSLDCLVPSRGCTVWFKRKLKTRVAITYDVLCPTPKPAIAGVQPRDINNFWLASDPIKADQGLFDSTRYTGKFASYDKMQGYYASTGGGGKIANQTTRMRRYPREVDGKPAEHLALNDKDGLRGYLITPDKVMRVQLVAYDDVIQYIVDGKLVYQIARGDRVQVETRDAAGERKELAATYDLDRFPVYREGYFGFRMVGTHHIYTNFKVHRLDPAAGSTSPKRGDKEPKAAESAKPFVHPGLLHSSKELNFIRSKIDAKAEPWKSAWDELQSSDFAALDYKPRASAEVIRGVRNNPNIGSSDFSNDSAAVYAHALQWSLTGKTDHATKAIEILNAWSSTLKSVSGHDAKLLVGMAGVGFCNAAELIRHSKADWQAADQKQFERMLRQVFYPVIKDFYPTANGNWDASMIQTMLAMGVFLDDRLMFDRAVNYFLHGEGNGAIEKYLNDFGECQESGRDQAHTQMGLGFLGTACEMAWKQGVDLYGAADNRLAIGFEYTAKYNLGEDVPYKPYRSVEGRYHYRTLSRRSRGRFRPIYERIVHHYHKRSGLEMPYCRKVAETKRPEKPHDQHISWGTLMFYGLPDSR